MSNIPSSDKIHPFFKPGSLYRLATEQWIWFDGGQTAIQRFFDGQRRLELHRQWEPGQNTNWGYSDKFNQALNHFLENSASNVPAEPALGKRAPADISRGKGDAGYIKYPLFRIDLADEKISVEPPEENEELYLGQDSRCGQLQKELFLEIRNVPVEREWALLIISEPILRLLNEIVKKEQKFPDPEESWMKWYSDLKSRCTKEIKDDSTARNILQSVFSDGLTQPEEETEATLPQFQKAWWTAMTLGEAVGTSGSPLSGNGATGTLEHIVELNNPCPVLASCSDHYWSVLCLGPEAGKDDA